MEKSSEINEMKIVFIYDRLSCIREEDDPKDAILYFHPETVSVDKKVAMCGQLMGVTHFFTDTFSSPKILTLANGKFALRNFGDQYVLALGCHSRTSDWLLEKEADILESVIKFFHCDIKNILFNANNDPVLVSKKLTGMMDHYIPISQHHGDLFSLTFGILPILYLPKSANNISLQASIILQTCLMKCGVLGGIVMYQNKVVGVELGQTLAQKLAFIQPYKMPPADLVKLDFNLPIGVQIFRVYIQKSEYNQLIHDSSKYQHPQSFNQNNQKKKKEIDIISSQIQEENGGVFSDLIKQNGSINNGKNLSNGLFNNGDIIITHQSKIEPRRCQSVVELYESKDFDLVCKDIEFKDGKKKHGGSVCDPTFPYLSSNGRNSVSSSFNNSNSTELNEYDSGCCEVEKKIENKPQNSSPISSTPDIGISETGIRRPIDLPLLELNKLSGPQRIKKKLWDTFNELLSPIESNQSTFYHPSIIERSDPILNINQTPLLNQSSNSNPKNQIGGGKSKIPESIHLRLLNSFRRVSHEYCTDDNNGNIVDGDNNESSSSNYSTSTSNSYNEDKESQTTSYSSSKLLSPPRILNRKIKSKIKSTSTQKSNIKKEDEPPPPPLEEVGLYVYYDGSMRLLLLLDTQVENNPELIHSIWEYVSSSLIQLKMSVMNVEEESTFSNQTDPYCFLRYESVWRSLAHGGRNESMDFNMVQFMHRDFTINPKINELIIRGDDHVVYGYSCTGSEVYYQQRAGLQPGLPQPHDLMGKVPIKAKRRLERDHSIVLL